MPEQAPLLFETNPEEFVNATMMFTFEDRVRALKGNMEDVALCEIIRYGRPYGPSLEPLFKLYREVVLGFPVQRRFHLFGHIRRVVEEDREWVSQRALLPFIVVEPLRDIVATAVIDYVSVGPLNNDDPMTRPKEIVDLIGSGGVENRGAVFGGLLHLGDERVCRLIRPLRDLLDAEEVGVAIQCTTGFLYSSSVEFEIDWLEEMDGDEADRLFGIVASGLTNQVRQNRQDVVFTGGERSFPIPHGNPTDTEVEENRKRAKLVPVEEYARRIAPRLYALERTEPPPRIMPHVLAAWNLPSVTDPREAAPIDDRHPKTNVSRPVAVPDRDGGDIVESTEVWFDGEGRLFLSWDVLNPNGPTLCCLGERIVRGESQLFYRWLNMFGGATYHVVREAQAQVTYNEIHDTATMITQYLSLRGLGTMFSPIPSFVIPNDADETIEDIAKRLIAADEPQTKDWGREVTYIEAFGDDYYARAGCELRVVYEAEMAKPDRSSEMNRRLESTWRHYGDMPAFRDAVLLKFLSSPFTPELFERWWDVVGTARHSNAAIGQLGSMWRGAVSLLSDDRARGAIPFDRVVDFLETYKLVLPK